MIEVIDKKMETIEDNIEQVQIQAEESVEDKLLKFKAEI